MQKSVFFIILLYVFNILLAHHFDILISIFQITLIHTFLFSLLVLKERIYRTLILKKTKQPFNFLAINVFNFFICLLYITPFILFIDGNSQFYVVCNFFICFFLYLVIELFIVLKNKL